MHRLTSLLHQESELMQACRVLYGPKANIDHQFLRILQPKELKSTYRRRALDTHPDSYFSQFTNRCARTDEPFIEVTKAYQKLQCYLRQRAALSQHPFSFVSTAPSWKQKNARGNGFGRNPMNYGTSNESYPFSSPYAWHRPGAVLPRWKLKLGEYLCYSQIVGWNDLTSALIWQRSCRPRIGEIASRWRWISPERIKGLLRHKSKGEKTGEVLLRNEIINSFQLAMLLRFQSECQPLLGQYFVQRGLMDEIKMLQHLANLFRHNTSL